MASKQRSLANLAALIDSASGSIIDFNAGLIADTLSGNGAGLSGVTSYTDSDTLAYLTTNSYATQSYVGTQINNLIDGAPGTLNTLNEIAAALNDDDSAYGTLLGLISAKDSDYIKTAITPSYIQSNQTTYSNVSEFTNDANYLDSSTVTGVISGSYIQANQTTYSTADFVDSAYVSANYLATSSLNVPVTQKDTTIANVSLNSSTTVGVINKAGSTISVTLTT